MMQPGHTGSSTETIARRGMRLCWPMRDAQGLAAFDAQIAFTGFSPRRQRGLTMAGGVGSAAGIRLGDRRGPFERNEAELNTESPLGGRAHRPHFVVVRTGVGATREKNKCAYSFDFFKRQSNQSKATSPRGTPGGVVSNIELAIGRGPAWVSRRDFFCVGRAFWPRHPVLVVRRKTSRAPACEQRRTINGLRAMGCCR